MPSNINYCMTFEGVFFVPVTIYDTVRMILKLLSILNKCFELVSVSKEAVTFSYYIEILKDPAIHLYGLAQSTVQVNRSIIRGLKYTN